MGGGETLCPQNTLNGHNIFAFYCVNEMKKFPLTSKGGGSFCITPHTLDLYYRASQTGGHGCHLIHKHIGLYTNRLLHSFTPSVAINNGSPLIVIKEKASKASL